VKELVEYLNPNKETDNSTVYWSGFAIALGTAIAYSMAILYYQRQKKRSIEAAHSQEHAHDSACEHGHSHSLDSHGNLHSHKFLHLLEHLIGLWLYNFCMGVGGAYYAYLGDNSPANTQQIIAGTFIVTIVGLLIGKGETQVHELFLEHAHEKHGSILKAMWHNMVTDILQQPTPWKKFSAWWINWGSFFSHVSAAGFGIGAAINAFGLLYFGKIPSPYIREPIAWTIGAFGAAVHNNSELMALKESVGIKNMLNSIREIQGLKAIFVGIFLFVSFLFSIFHMIPESFALPSKFTPETVSMGARIGIAAAFAFRWGVPDIITFIPLVLEATLKLFKGENQEYQRIAAPVVNKNGAQQTHP
ncbi:MAG: hypothetical protein ACHP6H_04800, partial [Legionellales bacterium]